MNEETFGSSEYSSIETLPSFFVTQPFHQEGSALDQLKRINALENDELVVSIYVYMYIYIILKV